MTARIIFVLSFLLCLPSIGHDFAVAPSLKKVLIIVHSRSGNTLTLAKNLKEGLEKNATVVASIKRVPLLSSSPPSSDELSKIPIASLDELQFYDALLFGSPVYFSAPAAEMLAFLQGAMTIWREKILQNKKALVFLSSNKNGVDAASNTLRSTLRALHMDVDSLVRACPDATGALVSDGECIARAIDNDTLSAIELPDVPEPIGLYKPYKIVGNLIYINQIALKNGIVEHPGVIGIDVSEEDAKISTRDAMLNVLAVLNYALKGDLSRVKQIVEITGFFNAKDGYQAHATLLNEASSVAVELLGDMRGAHTRASVGVSSLPMNSPVELKAIVEIDTNGLNALRHDEK